LSAAYILGQGRVIDDQDGVRRTDVCALFCFRVPNDQALWIRAR
jgi:hypothetical protein